MRKGKDKADKLEEEQGVSFGLVFISIENTFLLSFCIVEREKKITK